MGDNDVRTYNNNIIIIIFYGWAQPSAEGGVWIVPCVRTVRGDLYRKLVMEGKQLE